MTVKGTGSLETYRASGKGKGTKTRGERGQGQEGSKGPRRGPGLELGEVCRVKGKDCSGNWGDGGQDLESHG